MSRLPPFPTDREGYIAALNEYINQGVDVENCRRVLRRILENTEPDLPNDDPKYLGLPELAVVRLKQLEWLKECQDLDSQDAVNINAIIEAYQSGDLEVIEGKMSLWWDGTNKTGPITNFPSDMAQHLSAWRAEAPGGRLWVERGCVSLQMGAKVALH